MLKTRHKIAIARTIYRALRAARRPLGLSDTAVVERGGVRWSLDLSEGIDLAIYLTGYFERGLVRSYSRLIKPGQVIVDVGANIGAHTLHFARLVGPGGRVIAFEPTRFAFQKLRANVDLNPHLKDRTTLQQALLVEDGHQPPEAQIGSSWPLEGGGDPDSEHGARSMSTEGAIACTLDQYLATSGVPKVDVLKIDVDGNEWRVIRGARETLERHKPLVLMEFAPYLFEAKQFDDMLSTLASLGYLFYEAESLRPLEREPSTVRARIARGASINVLLTTTPAP